MPIKNRFGELFKDIKSWRHHLHENPELLYETIETSNFVENKLKEFGCDEVVTGLGRTGVVGLIRGRNTSSKKVIGLRADMDALPLQEKTGLDYASKVPGVMHACGHDGHTAMLLGAAKYLTETRNFDGTVVVIFQPAEEGGAGAKEMVDDGLIDDFRIQEVYGMHNMPGLDLGSFSIKEGDFFAAADTFLVTITGKGGHAAKPQETIDPVIIGSNIVMALQTITSRNTDPLRNVVLSVCTFNSDTAAFNIIPETVILKGTVRTFEKDVQEETKKNLLRISETIATSYGGVAKVEYFTGYPVMRNTAIETKEAKKIAENVSGAKVVDAKKIMGAEDFSFMLNSCKGAYILIGNGNSSGVHSPSYVFNDDVLTLGASFWAELVETRMKLKN